MRERVSTMDGIPHIRATQLTLYVDYFRSCGAPVEKYLEENTLPIDPLNSKEDFLPLVHSLQFLEQVSEREGITDLPSLARPRAVKRLSYGDSFLTSVFSAVTLKQALQAMRKLCIQENSQARVWFNEKEENLRICYRFDVPADAKGIHILELHTYLTIITVLRNYAGFDWEPNRAAFSAPIKLCDRTLSQFQATQFQRNASHAWIECPINLLHCAPQTVKTPFGSNQINQQELEFDFPTALRKILHSYMGDGHIHLQEAAEIASMSPRTLQRRLSACGLSFSELLQQLRYETAAELLKDPDISILEIANRTGWNDHSHFTRAFRQYAGVTPRAYRRQMA